MSDNTGIKIKKITVDLPKFRKQSQNAFYTAQKKAAIQFLTWCNAGSPNESATPPIRWGILRGSSSAFVGSEMVYAYPQSIKPGSGETIDPAKSYDGNKGVITVVWNTNYAVKMHEEKNVSWYELGPFSKQARNATDKWLEKHIANDKDALQALIAKFFMESL